MGSSWGPPGSCRSQMGPMLAPWTLLWGNMNSLSAAIVEVAKTIVFHHIMFRITVEIQQVVVVSMFRTVYWWIAWTLMCLQNQLLVWDFHSSFSNIPNASSIFRTDFFAIHPWHKSLFLRNLTRKTQRVIKRSCQSLTGHPWPYFVIYCTDTIKNWECLS